MPASRNERVGRNNHGEEHDGKVLFGQGIGDVDERRRKLDMFHGKMTYVPKDTDLSKAVDETEKPMLENTTPAYLILSLRTELLTAAKAEV